MAQRDQVALQAYKTWKRLLFQHRIGVAAKLLLIAAITILFLLAISHLLHFDRLFLILIFISILVLIIWMGGYLVRFSPQHLIDNLNHRYPWLEFSAQLIPVVPEQIIHQLQRDRVLNALAERRNEIKAWPDMKKLLLTFGMASLLYVLVSFLNFSEIEVSSSEGNISPKVTEVPVVANEKLPEILSIEIGVNPPKYTGIPSLYSESPSLEVPVGSMVNFNVELSDSVDRFQVIWNGEDTLLVSPNPDQNFGWGDQIKISRFYQFQFMKNNFSYSSPIYTVHVIEDNPPVINLESPAPYTFVLYGQLPKVDVKVRITDDYGLKSAQLVATVSRGSGESVKFREEKLSFSESINGKRNATLNKRLDFSLLKMEPGDELYFYVEANDHAQPSQHSRSETYFIQWEDTTSNSLSMMNGIAIDNMPAYFRSQRQIIIDTERLLQEQNLISKEEFKQRSNDLGIDQKILRLRYGKFLGEEFETTIVRQAPSEVHDDHDHEGEDHDHDHHDHGSHEEKGSATHIETLYDQDHDHSNSDPSVFGSGEGLIEQYEHRHDVAEAATFFEEATKTQLKAALAQMWESELRLRTLRPNEALKYEYKALELIKAVQQKNRVYVERVGFEPPPLKPGEKRLSGDMDEVTDSQRTWEADATDRAYPQLRKAVAVLETIRQNPGSELSPSQIITMKEAGNELAAIILQQPGISASILNRIRNLISEVTPDRELILNLQQDIVKLLPQERSGQGLEAKNKEPEMDHFINILKE